MYTIPRTPAPQSRPLARVLRPLPVSERRERDFGVGYGNSSGYASGRRYAPTGAPRFRVV
ncbi:hypothetical protein [Luteimonas wenzhouensis]|uniref:Uncharacterized protein n=1 Tax=Luteimonas wenzhouensis TaxID=2599615 RepID=A0A5C5TUW2_9GAMM|nr:hypothetical protein [Luteimonas wenzhouensis]NLW95536.1 hypothetical protein [Xanthomonadaceae bacterium]TWT17971.1 hypothetical protein FQY79_11710 [Luteimonas wenzhouensis]